MAVELKSTYVTLIATLAAGLIGIYFFPYYSVTPGVLAGGHRALENNCFACHTPGRGAVAEKCTACHVPASIGRTTVAGVSRGAENTRSGLIHRSIPNIECFYCHTEHQGRSKEGAAHQFIHGVLPIDARANCAACHRKAAPADILHAASKANDQCGKCHTTEAWQPATYDHVQYFRFDKHHSPRCTDCHRTETGFSTYNCYGCHEHTRSRIVSEHEKERIRDFENCVKCHRSGDADEIIGRNHRNEDDDHRTD